MKPPAIDPAATQVAISKFALPPCLHVPIAASDELAIERFIGSINKIISPGTPNRAMLIDRYEAAPRDLRLKIWKLENSSVLQAKRQLWVQVNYTRYRQAYAKAFPGGSIKGRVLDHVMNREVARLKGFSYLRIVPISRAANSSSGGLSERWAQQYHGTAEMRRNNLQSQARIQYADLADIVKMLDMKTGGSLQHPVNEAQSLVRPS